MKKVSYFASIFLLISCSSFALATDSTDVHVNVYQPQLPKVVQETATSQCIEAQNSKAIFVLNNGTTGGWRQSACPQGYMPYSIKTRVDMALGNGAFQWRNYCCRVVLKYQ